MLLFVLEVCIKYLLVSCESLTDSFMSTSVGNQFVCGKLQNSDIY